MLHDMRPPSDALMAPMFKPLDGNPDNLGLYPAQFFKNFTRRAGVRPPEPCNVLMPG